MSHPQLPRVPHATRWLGPPDTQPFRWAVVVNEDANGELEYFADGVLLGWQGFHSPVLPHPMWRYWDGDLMGRRITLGQWLIPFSIAYRWTIFVREPATIAYYTLSKWQAPSFNRLPWDDIPFNYPFEPLDAFAEPDWLPGNTWVYWYRTAQAALEEWPDALQQEDYWETFGRSFPIES